MGSVPNTLRTQIVVAVAAPIVVGLALTVGWLINQRDAARTAVDSSIRATAAADVTVVRADLSDQLSAAATASPSSAVTYPASAVLRAPVSSDAAFTARDSGQAVLDDTARPPAIIVPVYRGAPPGSTSARRASIVGYRVVALDLRPVLNRLLPQQGGLSVFGPSTAVASTPHPAPSGADTFAVDLDVTGSPGWSVQVWQATPGVPATAWLVAVGLLLLAAGTAGWLLRLVLRNAEGGTRERLLEKDRTIVNGVAPLLQSSLDVAEVLPAVAAHLAGNLELAGLTLSASADSGERQLYVWGDAPDASVQPRADTPERLDAGQTFAVALTRGGRTFGVLRVVAGVQLGPYRLTALRTAADLMGSSMANAETFARQQELLDRMHAVDELKTVFLATASHELRTPVTAIVGFSTLLLNQWEVIEPARARGLVDRVASNGRRLNSLIEQLLDFSQLERGLPQAMDEVINLGATVTRLLEDRPEFTAEHELDVVVATECLIRGSGAAIERVVSNLVGNAAKYSPAGTRITVTVDCDGDTAFLYVDDQGNGVPEAERERIFSRFYRGRGDSVTRTRGAGIGLSIVSEYAASMSATVSVATAPGGGARFVVRFPAVGRIPVRAPALEVSDVPIP